MKYYMYAKHLHMHYIVSFNIPTSAYTFDLANLLHFQHSYAKFNVHGIHKDKHIRKRGIDLS